MLRLVDVDVRYKLRAAWWRAGQDSGSVRGVVYSELRDCFGVFDDILWNVESCLYRQVMRYWSICGG